MGMTSPSQDSFLSDVTTPAIVEDRELEMLIIAFIQTLKRGNKKYGKDGVFKLVKDSLDEEISGKHSKSY